MNARAHTGGRRTRRRTSCTIVAAWLLLTVGCARSPLSSARWEPLQTGVTASLRGVCAVGAGVVWASGSDGTVLRSLDDGQTWQRFQVSPPTSDLRDIEAIDATHAWVIAITEPARVLRTRDGGASWEVLYESGDAASFFDSIALLDGGGGIVFGDPKGGVFEILRSDDGVSWRAVPAASIPPAADGEAAFAASGTCVVAVGPRHAWIGTGGRRARVLHTTDAGRTWQAAATPIRQGGATTGIYSVAFRDALHGVIVGGDYTKPELPGDNAAWTDDGGVTWTPARTPPGGYRSCVVSLPDDPGSLIAVGRAGSDWSADGGRTWHPLDGDPGCFAASAAPDGAVFAVGDDGRAARLVVRAN